jgi:small subunit ribosomal protein S2
MTRLPGALFVVDIKREHIAIKEAQKLNIPIFAMVDTNSDPRQVDYVIPSNDDASKSIHKVLSLVTSAVADGLTERKSDKSEKEGKAEKSQDNKTEVKAEKKSAAKKKVVATYEEE